MTSASTAALPPHPPRQAHLDAESLYVAALLAAATVAGLLTVGDYGITVDEYNVDDYGPKALAWYTSWFADRRIFNPKEVEETIWFYGPWFHILTAAVQSLGVAEYWATRHAMTFLVGIAGIAALYPMARLAIGRWAGFAAISLCLTTGYLYGSLFFTPIDVPFMFAMTWATLAIILMASRIVPSWPATVFAGFMTGLAIATRSSGVITHGYLVGAMILCGFAAIARQRDSWSGPLLRIAIRTAAAVTIAWMTAFALWPWLQIGNPLAQFWEAFRYFANHPATFDFLNWGRNVTTSDLPWHYILGQLAARLPEGFLLLLIVGLAAGTLAAFAFLRHGYRALSPRQRSRLRALMLTVAHSRLVLIVWAAAILPIAVVIAQRSTMYDGIRHVLFLIPMLALIAAYGFVRLIPLVRRFPLTSAIIGGAYASYAVVTLALLHPLQYVAFNALAGGVHGAYGRFDLDYWSVAATTALRRLETRLDRVPGAFSRSPRLMICIGNREGVVRPMYRRPWQLEDEVGKADYVIETERWRCVEKQPLVLIDEVKRDGRSFAWIWARRPPQSPADAPRAGH